MLYLQGFQDGTPVEAKYEPYCICGRICGRCTDGQVTHDFAGIYFLLNFYEINQKSIAFSIKPDTINLEVGSIDPERVTVW